MPRTSLAQLARLLTPANSSGSESQEALTRELRTGGRFRNRSPELAERLAFDRRS